MYGLVVNCHGNALGVHCTVFGETNAHNIADFEHVLGVAKEGDFVYFDPPYVPLSATAYFTTYTGEVFDFGMQRRLRDVCDELDDKGVKWMLSNSHTDFVLGLYRERYNIRTVEAARAINCKGSKRGKVTEVLVTNFLQG